MHSVWLIFYKEAAPVPSCYQHTTNARASVHIHDCRWHTPRNPLRSSDDYEEGQTQDSNSLLWLQGPFHRPPSFPGIHRMPAPAWLFNSQGPGWRSIFLCLASIMCKTARAGNSLTLHLANGEQALGVNLVPHSSLPGLSNQQSG